MWSRLRRAVYVLMIAGCAGSTAGAPPDATIFCDDDDQCPVGQACREGICVVPIDAGPPADAPLAPAEIVVDPTTLDFGNALLGVDTTLSITITNIGEAELHVTALTVFEPDALPEYAASPTGDVNLVIAGGGSATVAVTLRPVDDQIDVGELRVASDDADEPQVVVSLVSDLKGTPDLEVAPPNVDYGTVSYGTATPRDVDVTNVGSGNTPLVVSGVSVTNDSGEGSVYTTELFDVLPDGTETPATIPVFLSAGDATTPADVLRVRVTFTAFTASSGDAPSEDLVLITNDSDPAEAEKHIPITGTVIGCDLPQPELCNGLDDDCDLAADEDDPESGAACTTGVPGICSPGVEHCLGGELECVPDMAAQPETCNNADDDCDGSTDDGLVQACANACGTAGVEFCVAGAWVGCNAPSTPSETCNGLDDDCDGVADDGNPGAGVVCATTMPGICTAGTTQCISGALLCVPNNTPVAESCNTLDDDCDSMSDEGDPGGGASCSTGLAGICAPGTIHCSGGALVCQQNSVATTESCNYADDDCNGVVDNGYNLTNDVNNCGSCGNVCSVANAVEACSSSACTITSCTGNNVNTNGTYSDGCECADDSSEATAGTGDTCPASIVGGTINEGGMTTLSGKIAVAGDEDWYEIAFVDAADSGSGSCDVYRPNITFSSNPSSAYRFQVYNTDCTARCTGAVNDFKYYSGSSGNNQCCYNSANPGPGAESCADQSFSIRIRVYRTAGTATCDTYSLLVKNGP